MKHIYFLCIDLNNIVINAVHSVELLKSNYKQKLSVWKHKPLNRTAFFLISKKSHSLYSISLKRHITALLLPQSVVALCKRLSIADSYMTAAI